MSTSTPRSGSSSDTTAQLSRCRSHRRSVSRGPISPRVTPSVASSSAYRRAWSSAAPKTSAASGPSAGTSVATAVRLASREDHHAPVRLLALRLAPQPGERDSIVDDLPLKRGHGPQLLRLAGARHLVSHGASELSELGPAPCAEAANVKHQPGPGPSPPVDGEPGQLLQRLKDLAVIADQLVEGRADDRDARPVAFHVHVDVAVKVRDVEEPLDVVGGDLAFLFERAQVFLVVRLGVVVLVVILVGVVLSVLVIDVIDYVVQVVIRQVVIRFDELVTIDHAAQFLLLTYHRVEPLTGTNPHSRSPLARVALTACLPARLLPDDLGLRSDRNVVLRLFLLTEPL